LVVALLAVYPAAYIVWDEWRLVELETKARSLALGTPRTAVLQQMGEPDATFKKGSSELFIKRAHTELAYGRTFNWKHSPPYMPLTIRFGGPNGSDVVIVLSDADEVLEVAGTGRTAKFLDVFYGVDTKKSGMHHPDGLLWIRRPDRRHTVRPERVPLRAVAPTILSILGLPKPASMSAEPLPEVAGVGVPQAV